ncbi:response regulator transcription factor [Fibrella aquatica]|jgi:DNA-binding response OmpR family regulator|uniref:response regulator transcription factor n=1 Tax=Fibrella aquatica TaxID=3242487 RepID=UPI0035206A58
MNTLIVEDEPAMAEEIALFLRKVGFICDVARTGKEASERIWTNNYDFVLIDLGLPDYDGFDLLQETILCQHSASYLILTASGELDSKLKGLNLGADDYMTKPFSLLELHARMLAINRRKHGLTEPDIIFAGFVLDPLDRRVHYGSREVELTRREYDLLYYLLLYRNRVLTRLQLAEHIWGNMADDGPDSNYIDVHLKNLRRKLAVYAPIDWLETVRGVGYRANLPRLS